MERGRDHAKRVSIVCPWTRTPCVLLTISNKRPGYLGLWENQFGLAVLGGQLGESRWEKCLCGSPKGKEFEKGKGSKGKRLRILPYKQNQSTSWVDKEIN